MEGICGGPTGDAGTNGYKEVKCPKCNKYLQLQDSACKHCGYKLSSKEQEKLTKIYFLQFNSSMNIGLIIFIIFILTALYLFK